MKHEKRKSMYLCIGVVAALLTGCAQKNWRLATPPPDYDVPPQAIYWFDDHRYISLENYKDCHHGTTYYNDPRQGIRTRLGRYGIENYQGRLINADPTGQIIVIPSSYTPDGVCPDKGCNISFVYSTDGGRSFRGWYYMRNTQTPYEDSKNYIVAATSDRVYISDKWRPGDYNVTQYPLIPGGGMALELPSGIRYEHFPSEKRPDYLKGLRTPSGQEYISCDDSIRPANLPATSK